MASLPAGVIRCDIPATPQPLQTISSHSLPHSAAYQCGISPSLSQTLTPSASTSSVPSLCSRKRHRSPSDGAREGESDKRQKKTSFYRVKNGVISRAPSPTNSPFKQTSASDFQEKGAFSSFPDAEDYLSRESKNMKASPLPSLRGVPTADPLLRMGYSIPMQGRECYFTPIPNYCPIGPLVHPQAGLPPPVVPFGCSPYSHLSNHASSGAEFGQFPKPKTVCSSMTPSYHKPTAYGDLVGPQANAQALSWPPSSALQSPLPSLSGPPPTIGSPAQGHRAMHHLEERKTEFPMTAQSMVASANLIQFSQILNRMSQQTPSGLLQPTGKLGPGCQGCVPPKFGPGCQMPMYGQPFYGPYGVPPLSSAPVAGDCGGASALWHPSRHYGPPPPPPSLTDLPYLVGVPMPPVFGGGSCSCKGAGSLHGVPGAGLCEPVYEPAMSGHGSGWRAKELCQSLASVMKNDIAMNTKSPDTIGDVPIDTYPRVVSPLHMLEIDDSLSWAPTVSDVEEGSSSDERAWFESDNYWTENLTSALCLQTS